MANLLRGSCKLARLEMTEQGALGVLVLNGRILGFTLQPDEKDRSGFYIPAGEYFCRRFHGFKWPDTFEIVVPGHTALLFHAGNVEDHTEGCILLGASVGKLRGNRAVLNSGRTFKQFQRETKDVDGFWIDIEDHYL